MGFFSWNCKSCGHPMLSPYVLSDINAWMNQVVVQFGNGTRLIGEYDGYGRVNDIEFDYGSKPECYHLSCWKAEGEPGYDCESVTSRDQGFFFDDGEHDMKEPDANEGMIIISEREEEEYYNG